MEREPRFILIGHATHQSTNNKINPLATLREDAVKDYSLFVNMHEGLGLLRLRPEIHLDYDGDRQAFLGTKARLTEDC